MGRSGQWRPTVQPYLEELGQQLLEAGTSDHSVAMTAAGVRLLVTPLEQELLMEMMGAGQQSFARKHVLVRDGLGLRVKLQSELKRLADTAGDERHELLSELNADVGLGCQLMHEITQEMNAITSVGGIAEAREFSAYRQQLVKVVSEAEKLVSGGADSSGELQALKRRGYAAPLAKPARASAVPGKLGTSGTRLAANSSPAWRLAILVLILGGAISLLWWFFG